MYSGVTQTFLLKDLLLRIWWQGYLPRKLEFKLLQICLVHTQRSRLSSYYLYTAVDATHDPCNATFCAIFPAGPDPPRFLSRRTLSDQRQHSRHYLPTWSFSCFRALSARVYRCPDHSLHCYRSLSPASHTYSASPLSSRLALATFHSFSHSILSLRSRSTTQSSTSFTP